MPQLLHEITVYKIYVYYFTDKERGLVDKNGDLETTGIVIIVVGAALVLACLAGNADNSFNKQKLVSSTGRG